MNKNARNILYLALIGCAVLGCARFTKTREQLEKDQKIEQREARTRIFEKRPDLLAEYSKEPSTEALTDKPYLKGKIVILRNEGSRYKPYENLSDEFDAKLGSVYATDPADIQTVVLLKEDKVDGGVYVDANGKPAARGVGFSCDVTIIDRTMGAVIFRKKFSPTFLDSAKVEKSPGDKHSVSAHNNPTSEAIDFLETLERR